MKSIQFSYWTDEKQEQLFKLMTSTERKRNIRKIAKHFGKSIYEVVEVFYFVKQKRENPPTYYVDEQTGKTVTVYRASFALGLGHSDIVHSTR